MEMSNAEIVRRIEASTNIDYIGDGYKNRPRCALGRMGGRLAALSYRTRLADGLDLTPFDALESRAVDYAVKLMTAAFQYRAGTLAAEDLVSLIGNKTYSGEEAG